MATLGSLSAPTVRVRSRRKLPGLAKYLAMESNPTYAGKQLHVYFYDIPPAKLDDAITYGGELVSIDEVADAIDA